MEKKKFFLIYSPPTSSYYSCPILTLKTLKSSSFTTTIVIVCQSTRSIGPAQPRHKHTVTALTMSPRLPYYLLFFPAHYSYFRANCGLPKRGTYSSGLSYIFQTGCFLPATTTHFLYASKVQKRIVSLTIKWAVRSNAHSSDCEHRALHYYTPYGVCTCIRTTAVFLTALKTRPE